MSRFHRVLIGAWKLHGLWGLTGRILWSQTMTIPPAMPWVKLHTSYLDDSRFARLDDGQKFRFFQLLMLAGQLDAGGYFTSTARN